MWGLYLHLWRFGVNVWALIPWLRFFFLSFLKCILARACSFHSFRRISPQWLINTILIIHIIKTTEVRLSVVVISILLLDPGGSPSSLVRCCKCSYFSARSTQHTLPFRQLYLILKGRWALTFLFPQTGEQGFFWVDCAAASHFWFGASLQT